jgi:murein DD-endopeptidase MepM/ murein hydrolase activator NlpD
MKKGIGSKALALLGGRGAYIMLAAAVLAAGGAGAAAYGRAVKNAENEYDLSIPDFTVENTDSSRTDHSAAAAEGKQTGVKRTDLPDSSQDSSDSSKADLTVKTAPNVMPVNGKILNPFSGGELVKSDTLGVWKTHDGVDIAADTGTAVKAMNRGRVTQVKEDPLWGYTVAIDHGSGVMSFYYNLSSAVAVSEGDEVESGQTIGAVGDTAEIEAAEASHLHFAVKRNGEWIDPVSYIDPAGNK